MDVKFNERTGEFEETKKKKGCGTTFLIVIILTILAYLYLI